MSRRPATPDTADETSAAEATRPVPVRVPRAAPAAAPARAVPAVPAPAGSSFRPAGPARAAPAGAAGAPLPGGVRTRFEAAFDTDLSGVRVHTEEAGDGLARERATEAVTVGGDVHFRAGAFRPGTPSGDRLLAHELTHVVQQGMVGAVRPAAGRPGGTASDVADPAERQAVRVARVFAAGGRLEPGVRGRRAAPSGPPGPDAHRPEQHGDGDEDTDDPTRQVIDEAAETLRPGVRLAVWLGLGGDDATLFDLVRTAVHDGLHGRDPAALERAGGVVDETADIATTLALPPPQGTVEVTLPGVLRRLAQLHATASGAGGFESSAGARHAARTVADHLAQAAASALPDDQQHVGDAVAQLWTDLDAVGTTLRDGTALLRLELEGTIAELIQLRRDFADSDDEEERRALGAQIGERARQALLLNALLTAGAPGGGPTALDAAVADRAAEIARLRRQAADEATTRGARGDEVTLLGAQRVAIDPQQALGAPDEAETVVEPGEAFPAATDAAERGMAGELGDRIRAQRAELASLRGQVVPEHPAYTLEEFAAVHRRWFGLYSPNQEQTDSSVQLALEMMGEPYRLMGLDVGSSAVAVEGGFARAYLMRLSVDLMTGAMTSGGTDQFADQITAARLRRRTEVTGSAGRLTYRFGEIYTGAGTFQPTAAGEVLSRTTLASRRASDTAAAATAVSAVPAPLQPTQARRLGLVTGEGDVPLLGVKEVTAREGWTYLTDVHEPFGEVVAREQRTLSPEVVAYLLAAQQQTATLAATHVPRSGLTPLGSMPTRGGGVEASPATAEDRYLRGAFTPRPPGEVRTLAEQLPAARAESGVRPGHRPPGPETLIAALRGDLQGYLDRFFAEHQDIGWRLAAIFTIADTEHGVGTQLMALLDPRTLASMIEEAIKVTAVMSTLQALGPLGELAAHAYGAYLASQGVSNVAALISVAAFCHQASDADSLARARAWGYMARTVAGDAADLFSNLVMTAATTGLHAMVERGHRPSTPRELADALHPLMADPATRDALLAEVDARIAEHESRGTDRSDPELEALRAFRDSLEGVSRAETGAAAEAPLAGRHEEGIDRAAALTESRPRTAAETAALRAQLPADLASVPIVESSEAGNAVRVRYGDEGGLRVEVGRDAGPEHVRRHVETVRELRRYEGVLGRVRQLLSRVWQAISGHPAYGTAGFEARLEVRKLNTILGELYARQVAVDARAERLMGSGSPDLVRERATVDRDIAGIERQLDLYQRNLDSYDAGRGFVAAESTLRAGGGSTGLPLRDSAAMARADQRLRTVEAMLERNSALRDRFAGAVRALRVDYGRQRDAFLDFSPDSSTRSGGMTALTASERALEIESQASTLLGTLTTEAARPAGARPAFDAATFYASIRTLPPGERVARVELVAGDVAAANRMIYDAGLSSLNNRSVYRHPNGELYSVDTQHGSFERCDSTGKHLGEVRFDFTHLDGPDKTGGHDLTVR
ncbi:DUF4157 domain-containing protein [Micromonospora sp. NPDC005806]|uniref:eCIS core domain-containing protein n=1 Tax=Micromonospora sp. NPDC005806 TaxID=3364234 RepID=UPI0036AEFFC7